MCLSVGYIVSARKDVFSKKVVKTKRLSLDPGYRKEKHAVSLWNQKFFFSLTGAVTTLKFTACPIF